jgi:probable addiction module antidote protein
VIIGPWVEAFLSCDFISAQDIVFTAVEMGMTLWFSWWVEQNVRRLVIYISLNLTGSIIKAISNMKKLRNFRDYHIGKLRDAEEAQIYLDVALEEYEKDGDADAFLLAIRDVAEARGGLSKLADTTHLNRQNLYKVLSKEGNPKLHTIGSILHALGFRLSVRSRRHETVT